MLILTRKTNESIIIDDNIEIIVVGVEDGKVKLGIKAPKEVDIHRKEVYESIQQENRQAANAKSISMDLLKDFLKLK